LELVDVWISEIQPKQAHTLVKLLGDKAPLSGLEHLKRVAKHTDATTRISALSIILCRRAVKDGDGGVEDGNCSFEVDTDKGGGASQAPEVLQSIIQEHSLKPRLTQVSLHAPATKEQHSAWSSHWPITWRPPDPHLRDNKPGALPQAAQDLIRQQMAACLARMDIGAGPSGAIGHEGPCRTNAAIIVNPATGAVIAEGLDDTQTHPLRHAIMVAIEAAAERDCRLWPDRDSNGGPMPAPPSTGSPCEASELCGPGSKRQRCPCGEVEAAAPDAGSRRAEEGKGPGPRPYLCTGLHCYVATEPCAMCAMAMVHSRIAVVVYCQRDPLHGALGGAFHLHQQRSLNHHYEVYQLPLVPNGTQYDLGLKPAD